MGGPGSGRQAKPKAPAGKYRALFSSDVNTVSEPSKEKSATETSNGDPSQPAVSQEAVASLELGTLAVEPTAAVESSEPVQQSSDADEEETANDPTQSGVRVTLAELLSKPACDMIEEVAQQPAATAAKRPRELRCLACARAGRACVIQRKVKNLKIHLASGKHEEAELQYRVALALKQAGSNLNLPITVAS